MSTLEDLLERIVGDIYDEYDRPAAVDFDTAANGDFLIEGSASIAEMNKHCDLAPAEADFNTIGGYVFGALGRIPAPGDTIHLDGSGDSPGHASLCCAALGRLVVAWLYRPVVNAVLLAPLPFRPLVPTMYRHPVRHLGRTAMGPEGEERSMLRDAESAR